MNDIPMKKFATLLSLLICIITFMPRCNPFAVREDPLLRKHSSYREIWQKMNDDVDLLLLVDQQIDILQNQLSTYFSSMQYEEPDMLSQVQRDEIKALWIQYMDLFIILNTMLGEYRDFSELNKNLQNDAFLIGYSAYLILYYSGHYFLENTASIDVFEVLLDEPIPEYSTSEGMYTNFKWEILKIEEYFNLDEDYLRYRKIKQNTISPSAESPLQRLTNVIEKNYTNCKQNLTLNSESLRMKNYIDSIKDNSYRLYFPIQKNIALFMSHTRFTTRKNGLISPSQCVDFIQKSEPGDIILERKEWYMTNLGIPGFWPHSALYIGNLAELQHWSNTAEIREYYYNKDPECTGFVHYIERKYPDAFRAYLMGDNGNDNRILEGLKEGIIFHSVEGSVGISDHVASLRPRLGKLDIAQALEKAFSFWGKPYDFSFSLLSDNELVCSELVYKSYEAAPDKSGLSFQPSEIAGILTLPANNIAAQFDREFDHSPQMDFVLYYSGDIHRGKSYPGNVSEFRNSHLRSRWSFYLLDN
jgi:hypothetical protein